MDWTAAILGSFIGGFLLYIIIYLLRRMVRRLISDAADSTRKWLGIAEIDQKVGKLGSKVDYIRREQKRLKDRIDTLEQAAHNPGTTDCKTTKEEIRGEEL